MIHEFKIKNVFSFDEEQILSFEATSDKTYSDIFCIDIKPSLKLLKLAVVYGPNASGKTNLLKALALLRKLVLYSKNDKYEETQFTPFLLTQNPEEKDGEFYLSFFVQRKRFIYLLKLNKKSITHEKLIYYKTSQPSTLFERNYNEEKGLSILNFGDKLGLTKKEEIILEGNTIKNSTFLSIYRKSNVSIPLIEEVINWFSEHLMPSISPKTSLTGWTSSRVEQSNQCKEFVLDALTQADFNISDVIFDEEQLNVDGELAEIISTSRIPEETREKLLKEGKLKMKNISFTHSTSDGNYNLSFRKQSSGTQRYYGLSGALNELLKGNKILSIDEIETSLHYDLVTHFIKTFLVNSKTSQLLFTTHDVGVLATEFLRRDVIWLCEKNEKGASELTSVSEFSLHKNLSIFNAYKIGKLGAKPLLGSIYLNKIELENATKN